MVENFGFIHDKIDIKVLILFIMRRLPKPVAMNELTELTMCDDGISYFDVTQCIAELTRTRHLHFAEDRYTLTQKGRRNGEVLEKNLPYSVKAKAEEATSLIRTAQNRNSMIKTSLRGDEKDGYTVVLSLSDGVSDILSMELFAASLRQANSIEKGFRKNAEKIYHAIVELSTS